VEDKLWKCQIGFRGEEKYRGLKTIVGVVWLADHASDDSPRDARVDRTI